MSAPQKLGRLYLVPTPLDFGCEVDAGLDTALPAQTVVIAASITHWITENAKSTRAYLKRIDARHPAAAGRTVAGATHHRTAAPGAQEGRP